MGLFGQAGCDDPARSEPVAAVEIAAPDTIVMVGQTLQLGVAVRGAAGEELAGRRVAWSSSNEAVATVADGRVTGRAPGTATITATVGGGQDRVEVAVETPVARVTMEPDSFLLVVGNTVAIRLPTEDNLANLRARVLAVPRDAAGGVMLWRAVRFATSDAAVATVSDSGVVRALAPGTAVITARTGGAEGRLTVTVERPYTLTFLGLLEGHPGTVATGINELGQVVGRTEGTVMFRPRGFLWQEGRMTEILASGIPGSLFSLFPADINDRGQVGGTVLNSDGELFAFLWEGGRTTAARLPTRSSSVGGMNERGEMVGSWVSSPCTRVCSGAGWIFRDGVVSPIGSAGPGVPRLTLSAINDAGQIAGTREGSESGRALRLESAAAEPTLLPTSAALSNGLDVDEQGRVYGQDFVGGEIRAFVWSPGGGVTHFLPLRGGAISSATRANNRGLAVGRSGCIACPASLPVLFRNGRAIRLEDLSVAGDWVWEGAADINDRGQIVGHGRNRATGLVGALLLTPPAP
jgi:probable HAF family extracellular repeat protein